MKALVALLFAAPLAGCTLDVCAEHPPSFELEITVDKDVSAPVRSFTVNVSWLDNSFSRHFVVGDALDDGLTSIGVELDPPPTDEVDVMIQILGYDGEDVDSRLVAEDRERVELSPNGCNIVPIDIDPIEEDR